MVPLLSQIRKIKSANPVPQIWAAEPSDRDRYWQQIRSACKDEAAFKLVQEIWQELQIKQELALQKSNEKFSKAFRSNPTAIMITALKDGRCIEVNESFEQISGYSRNEVIGKTTRELNLWHHPSDCDRVRHLLTTEGSIRNLELEFRLKSGEIGIGLFSAEVMEFDGEPCLIATTEDITESKKAEAKLKAALERDRLLGEVALRIRQSLDLSQILQTTVAEVRQLLEADRVFIGYRDGIDCGKVLAESLDPQYPSVIPWHCDNQKVRAVAELFAHTPALIYNNVWEEEQTTEDRLFCHEYHVQACMLVPIWLGSELYGVIVVHQCRSPRNWQKFEVDFLEKLANQVSIAIHQGQLYHQVCRLNCCLEQQVQERTMQLEQQLQELQELSELKDFFLQAISHDLRTPIMGMLLVLQNLIKTSAQGTATISLTTLERMRQSIERQLEMLNTLLDTQAIAAGADRFDFRPLNLANLFQSTLADLEPILERNQTKVITAIPDHLPLIKADEAQLRRVLENLITNALKHNPPGLDLLLTAQIQSEQILCAVIDNGVGIHESDRLFERYGKVMRYSAGIGLGLYLCRQIIEAHGGKIWVESQLGQGASFYFTLPLEPKSLQYSTRI